MVSTPIVSKCTANIEYTGEYIGVLLNNFSCTTEYWLNIAPLIPKFKSPHINQPAPLSSAFLSLLLVMAVDSTRSVTPSGNQQCGNSLQQTLKLTRLIQKESVDLIKTYVSTDSELRYLVLLCKILVRLLTSHIAV